MLIEKLKNEGILDDIVNSLPMKGSSAKAGVPIDVSGSDSLGQQRDNSLGRNSIGGRRRTSLVKDGLNRLEKDKRYLSVNVVHGVAFVDFVNPRDDEEISIAVSFLKNRYMTKKVQANCEFNLGETFIFELEGDFAPKAFDASLLLKLNQKIHLTILRHRSGEKPVVIGTTNLDWRSVLYANSVEVNAEILPVDLTQKGSLGKVQLNIDLVKQMMKSELIPEETVRKQ